MLGEYNKNSPEPDPQAPRSAARSRVHRRTPTSTPRWASSRTSRTCPTSSSTAKTFFDALVSPRVHDHHRRRRRRAEPRASSSSRSTGATGRRGTFTVDIPAGARAQRPDLRARALDRADPALGDGRLPRPVRVPRRKDQAAMDMMLDLAFGQTSDLYKRLVEQEQKVDQLFQFGGPNVDPTLFTVFARVKNPSRRGLRPRRDPAHLRGSPREEARCQARRGCEVEHPVQLRSRARQHGVHRCDAGPLRSFRAVVRHGQPLLRAARHAHARRHPEGRAEVFHRQEPGRDHALAATARRSDHQAAFGADSGRAG